MNFHTPLSRLRLIGMIEGISCILLFFVAMPMKWIPIAMKSTDESLLAMGKTAVLIVGSIHGGLWILFVLAVVHVWIARRWPLTRVLLAGVASIPPGGTFLFDRTLRKEQIASANPSWSR